MSPHKRFRSAISVVVLTLVATLVVSCGSRANSEAEDRKEVVLLTVSQTCDYCAKHTDAIRGAMAAADVDLRVVVNEYNAADQAQQVTQAISTDPDAIIVFPADARAIIPSLERIKDADIPVVVANSYPQTDDTSLWDAYTGPNDIENGAAAAHAMLQGFREKGYGDSGNIAMLTGPPGTPPSIERRQGFEDEMARIAPGIRVIASQPADWDQTQGTTAASTLFTQTRNDDLRGMYAQDDSPMAGALVAARRQGIDLNDLVMVGHNCSIEGYNNIESGAQFGSVLQSPIEDGDLTAKATIDILDGKDVENVQYLTPRPITKDNLEDCREAVGK